MFFGRLDSCVGKLFWGNILLVICSAFYLAWWIVAFRPKSASKGLGTNLLLLAAVAAGIGAVVFMTRGISTAPHPVALFPSGLILWGGIAVYLILLVVTAFLLRRQVTTELFLIIGWAMLELSAIDALYGTGQAAFPISVFLIIVIAVAVVVSMICYLLYYRLEQTAGYSDGMIPLIVDAAAMACVAIATVI